MIYGILGGDFRNIELVKLLAKEKNIVYTYGLEKEIQKLESDNIIICDDIKELQETDIVITSIPLSKDNININMPLNIYGKESKIDEALKVMNNKLIFTGSVSSEILRKFKLYNIEILDIMKNEEFAVLNAIPTAEETIRIIVDNTKKVLHNANCLIMGYGRIGKVLAKKLNALSVKVECLVSDNIEKTWCRVEGYNYIEFENIKNKSDLLKKYDIIVNTIPKIILTEELKEIKKDTLIIDLASKPYGIDRNIVKQENLNFIEALGLPGKSAPITVAENMYELIKNVLVEKQKIN